MTMRCPRCGQAAREPDRGPTLGVAACRACGRTLSLVGAAEGASARERLPKPREVRVRRAPHRLWLSYRWFSLKKIFAGSLATVTAAVMTAGAVYVAQIESGWLVRAAPLLFGPLTLLIAYGTLADLVNRTTIEWTPNRLRVQHGPVRFGGGPRELDPMQIDQLFCRRRHVSGAGNRKGYWVQDLVAVLRDGEPMTLIAAARTGRLRYIGKQLEQAMGVVDRPVRGEC